MLLYICLNFPFPWFSAFYLLVYCHQFVWFVKSDVRNAFSGNLPLYSLCYLYSVVINLVNKFSLSLIHIEKSSPNFSTQNYSVSPGYCGCQRDLFCYSMQVCMYIKETSIRIWKWKKSLMIPLTFHKALIVCIKWGLKKMALIKSSFFFSSTT